MAQASYCNKDVKCANISLSLCGNCFIRYIITAIIIPPSCVDTEDAKRIVFMQKRSIRAHMQ